MASKLIPATKLRAEYLGGVSDMSLWRWMHDPALGFPQPIRIQGRRYWREADIADWLEAREAA
jgi:predicted DNA-binding transcriptional regulator AlpA